MTSRTDAATGELEARAAIQRGETGDKVPGFDPAAAPLETDAEAGGAPYGGGAHPATREAVRPAETGTGSAMRATADDAARGQARAIHVALVITCILAAVLAVTLMALSG